MINYRLFLLRWLLFQKPALDVFLEAKITVANLTINYLDENSVLTLETDASSNAVGIIL